MIDLVITCICPFRGIVLRLKENSRFVIIGGSCEKKCIYMVSDGINVYYLYSNNLQA